MVELHEKTQALWSMRHHLNQYSGIGNGEVVPMYLRQL